MTRSPPSRMQWDQGYGEESQMTAQLQEHEDALPCTMLATPCEWPVPAPGLYTCTCNAHKDVSFHEFNITLHSVRNGTTTTIVLTLHTSEIQDLRR